MQDLNMNSNNYLIMKIIVAWIALLALGNCHSLEHCINHILHESWNEDFHCHNNEEIHFYSTYALPDGAYRCLDEMKGKQGFYISTVKQFKHIVLTAQQVELGQLIREDMKFRGWKCNQDGLVKSTLFQGLKLFLSKCKHNEVDFEDICIIKGWPLAEVQEQIL